MQHKDCNHCKQYHVKVKLECWSYPALQDSGSSVLRYKFTPMSYLKYTACEFQRSIGQFEVEKESKCTADNISTDINVHFLTLIDEPGNAEALTQEHRAKGKNRLDSFLNFHRNKSIVIFSDGSTDYNGLVAYWFMCRCSPPTVNNRGRDLIHRSILCFYR